jgi:hypothetical protein
VSRLALCLLGPPRIERDGVPTKLDRRKAVAFLAYIAVTGQSHRRASLVNLLWPEYDAAPSSALLARYTAALEYPASRANTSGGLGGFPASSSASTSHGATPIPVRCSRVRWIVCANTDENFFNDILKEVNADVLKIDKPDHLIFIEFARPNYVEAIQNFDKRILDRCLAIYMEVSFDISWERNVARHQAEMSQDGDDHFVYRETMEEIYLHDDRDAFVQYLKDRNIPVSVVDNEADGEEHLKTLVKELFENLF